MRKITISLLFVLIFLLISVSNFLIFLVPTYGLSTINRPKLSPLKSVGFLDPIRVHTYLDTFSSSEDSSSSLIGQLEERTFSLISVKDKETVFVNDLKKEDKVDILLWNFTLLNKQHYLNNGYVRVIILPSSQLEEDYYTMVYGANEAIVIKRRVYEQILSINGSVLGRSNILPFVFAEVPYKNVFKLAENANIAHIFLDKRYHVCLNESVPIIKPPSEWARVERFFGRSINGSGVKIAILDTGIDKTHPDLDDLDDNPETYDPKVIAEKSFTNENHTWDGLGHGTHCASIAAGTGEASNYKYVGVAPGAYLLNGKVLTDEGWGWDSWIISGIEWAVNNSADIISLSLGSYGYSEPMGMAVSWAISQGVVVVAAAGNRGDRGLETIDCPGCIDSVITVGATDKSDIIAPFSSRGPTVQNRTIKPDVVAPGVDIIAARATGTSMGTPINDYYTMASGTSMATPHVAGAIALLLQIHPNWSPEYIKSALISGSLDLNESYYAQGAGRINVCSSAIVKLIAVPPSSSFGLTILNKTTVEIKLNNVVNKSIDGFLSVETFFENRTLMNYVTSNTTALRVPSNESKVIGLHLKVPDDAPIGHYWGSLKATIENQTFRVIFNFMTLSLLDVRVSDFEGNLIDSFGGTIIAYDKANTTRYVYAEGYSPTYKTLPLIVYPGNYNVHALWITMGDFEDWLPGPTFGVFLSTEVYIPKMKLVNVTLSLQSAHNVTVHIGTPLGKSLSMVAGFRGLQYKDFHTTMAWWACNRTDDDIARSSYHSLPMYVSDSDANLTILFEGIHKGRLINFFPLSDEVYFIGWTLHGVNKSIPLELRYNESELAAYNTSYDMPGLFPYNSDVDFSFNPYLKGCWSPGCWWSMAPYAPSPPPYGFTQTYYIVPRYFWQLSYWTTYREESWWTQLFFPIWRDGEPWVTPITGEKKSVVTGRLPLVPVVYLNNTDDEIRLHTPLFQDIGGSLVKGRGEPSLEMFRNGQPVYNWSGYPYWFGIYPYQFIYNSTPGNYLFNLSTTTDFPISNKTEVLFSFSIPGSDINPPRIQALNIPDIFIPNEPFTVKINCTDDVGIANVSIAYSYDNGSSWTTIPVSQIDSNIFNSTISNVSSNVSTISLKVNITDTRGNWMQYTAIPISLKAITTHLTLSSNRDYYSQGDFLQVQGQLTDDSGTPLSNVAIELFLNDELKDVVVTNDSGYYEWQMPINLSCGAYKLSVSSRRIGAYLSSKTTKSIRVTSIIIDQTFVSDERANVGSIQVVGFHAKWAYDNSNVVEGSIYVNGTKYNTNGTGWIHIDAKYDTVGKRTWVITGVNCYDVVDYEVKAANPYVIFDRVKITLYTPDDRIDVGSNATIYWTGIYEYDNSVFNGSITLNNTRTQYDTVGSRGYKVISIEDPVYGLTTFTTNEINIIWDEVNIDKFSVVGNHIDVGDKVRFIVRGYYEYDHSPWAGTYALNDSLVKNRIGKYWYRIANITDVKHGLTTFVQSAANPYVIFDRVKITLYTLDNRVNVGSNVTILWKGVYEYDGSIFNGSVTLNNTQYRYDAVGCRGYKVISIYDPVYGLTAFTSNELKVIWDKIYIELLTSDSRIDVGTNPSLYFKATYLYDGSDATPYIKVTYNYSKPLMRASSLWISVKKVTDRLYGITVFECKPVKIIWDLIIVKFPASNIDAYEFENITINWSAYYAYDNSPLNATVIFNVTPSKIIEPGEYMIKPIKAIIHDDRYNISKLIFIPSEIRVRIRDIKFQISGQVYDLNRTSKLPFTAPTRTLFSLKPFTHEIKFIFGEDIRLKDLSITINNEQTRPTRHMETYGIDDIMSNLSPLGIIKYKVDIKGMEVIQGEIYSLNITVMVIYVIIVILSVIVFRSILRSKNSS